MARKDIDQFESIKGEIKNDFGEQAIEKLTRLAELMKLEGIDGLLDKLASLQKIQINSKEYRQHVKWREELLASFSAQQITEYDKLKALLNDIVRVYLMDVNNEAENAREKIKLNDRILNRMYDIEYVSNKKEIKEHIKYAKRQKKKAKEELKQIEDLKETKYSRLIEFSRSRRDLDRLFELLYEEGFITATSTFRNHFTVKGEPYSTTKSLQPIKWYGRDYEVADLFVCMARLGFIPLYYIKAPHPTYTTIADHFRCSVIGDYDRNQLGNHYNAKGVTRNAVGNPLQQPYPKPFKRVRAILLAAMNWEPPMFNPPPANKKI